MSPQDAALLIQLTFRAYLIRRSKALRALRELAIAKSKLKEIRALFNNFSYRRQVARDAEERQRFSEKIIVLLLTVDAIEVTLFLHHYYIMMVDTHFCCPYTWCQYKPCNSLYLILLTALTNKSSISYCNYCSNTMTTYTVTPLLVVNLIA